MKHIWAAVFGVAAGTGALAGTLETGSGAAVRVCVDNSVVTPFIKSALLDSKSVQKKRGLVFAAQNDIETVGQRARSVGGGIALGQ